MRQLCCKPCLKLNVQKKKKGESGGEHTSRKKVGGGGWWSEGGVSISRRQWVRHDASSRPPRTSMLRYQRKIKGKYAWSFRGGSKERQEKKKERKKHWVMQLVCHSQFLHPTFRSRGEYFCCKVLYQRRLKGLNEYSTGPEAAWF